MTTVLRIACPAYKFDTSLNLTEVGRCIDNELTSHFLGRKVVIRGIQSAKHSSSRDQIVDDIVREGWDRNQESPLEATNVSEQPIDLFGYACVINQPPIVLPVLEGFHRWKPKSLERPQHQVDIWMIYDLAQMDSVEYRHKTYGVMAKDAYRFKNPSDKSTALLGVLVVE